MVLCGGKETVSLMVRGSGVGWLGCGCGWKGDYARLTHVNLSCVFSACSCAHPSVCSPHTSCRSRGKKKKFNHCRL